VIGGIVSPAESPKAGLKMTAIPADADESLKMKRDSRLSEEVPPQDLTYKFLRRDSDGQYQEVPRDTRFSTGDAAQLRLEARVSGYLAVAELGEDGSWKMLFPPQSTLAARVDAKTVLILPESQYWEFGPAPRERKLIAVFTAGPQQPLVDPDGALRRPERSTILDITLFVTP
jgi:hypothetical protein